MDHFRWLRPAATSQNFSDLGVFFFCFLFSRIASCSLNLFWGEHVFSVRPFRRYLFRCRTFSAQIVSAPIRCSLTVHLFRVWVSVSKKHRILAPKRAAQKWSRRKVVDPFFGDLFLLVFSIIIPLNLFVQLSSTIR